MIIQIDASKREPPYRQIQRQVLEAIATGSLSPGIRLPTIRQLARDLDLAPNTVARAYRELETDGVIETRGRRGTFTTGADGPATQRSPADDIAAIAVAKARDQGVTDGQLASAMARALTT